MTEKKRSTYTRGSKFDLPAHVDEKKYKYRWISSRRLAANSDSYEERGYEVDKSSPDGQAIKREDVVLGRMPIDKWEQFKAQKDQDREDQLELAFGAEAQKTDELAHELKKAGGKLKFKLEHN